VIHFDFEDRYQDENVVGTAITRRDGVFVSMLVHGLLAAALIIGPQLPIFQPSAEELERRQEELERQREAAQRRRSRGCRRTRCRFRAAIHRSA
jgi:hypothetical protein